MIHKYFSLLLLLSFSLNGQGGIQPFLEIRPYAPPAEEQYPVHASVDHHSPTQTSSYLFIRLDGDSTVSTDPPALNCVDGQNCYDGHSGVDIWMPRGVPMLATAPGKIVWAEFAPGVDPCPTGYPPNGDLGVVIIDHNNGYYSAYLHLDPPLAVEVGQVVATGDTIGYNGDSGCASVTHLHYEIRKDAYYFDQEKSWVVDPYGWWGRTTDPIKEMRNASSVWLWKSSDLIDDGDNGFERYYGPQWERLAEGYGGDAWSAPAVEEGGQGRHTTLWVPELPEQGQYDLQVYVPRVDGAVDQAVYEVYVKQPGGTAKKYSFTVNQDSIYNSFFTIGTLNLPRGANCAVFLRDVVPAGTNGSRVVYDAIRFVGAGTGLDKNEVVPKTHNLEVMPNQPNPLGLEANSSGTYFVLRLRQPEKVKIEISNILGQKIKTLYPGVLSAGEARIYWNGKGAYNETLPRGVYIYTVSAGREKLSKKLVLIR